MSISVVKPSVLALPKTGGDPTLANRGQSRESENMAVFVGLDVGHRITAICVVAEGDTPLLETIVDTDAMAIASAIAGLEVPIELAAMEAGGTATWLAPAIRSHGLNVIQIDAVRVRKYTSASPYKSDRNDARAIANMVRAGLYHPVYEKSAYSQMARSLIAQRFAAIGQVVALKNSLRGSFWYHGLTLPLRNRARFEPSISKLFDEHPELRPVLEPNFELLRAALAAVKTYDREVERLASLDPVSVLLQTMPGVGPLIALMYRTTIDEPNRFSTPSAVGSYLRLAPRLHASGESCRHGRISRRGDKLMRAYLYAAAKVHLFRINETTSLRVWGQQVRERKGTKVALVAMSRKMAVIMLHMWKNNEPYRM